MMGQTQSKIWQRPIKFDKYHIGQCMFEDEMNDTIKFPKEGNKGKEKWIKIHVFAF